MLIDFKVTNYKSFNKKVELTMEKGRSRKKGDHVIKIGNIQLLKFCAIFGANASGKSNLIKALNFAREMVVNNDRKPGMSIVLPIFKWNDYGESSIFEFKIYTGENTYLYGFTIEAGYLVEENLYKSNTNKKKLIFNRIIESNGEQAYKFNAELQKNKQLNFIAISTNNNRLFMPNTVNNNSKVFIDLYNWFLYKLNIVLPNSKLADPFTPCLDPQMSIPLNEFFRNVDFGIDKVSVQEMNENEVRKLLGESSTHILKDINEGHQAGFEFDDDYFVVSRKKGKLIGKRLSFIHNNIPFEFSEESDGTRRMVDFLPIILNKYSRGQVFVVDELGRSLHTELITHLLNLFIKSKINSQLIFTTHRESILSSDLFRSDEIWLMDKNKKGESEIHSLDEYKFRSDLDIEKAYKLGRFGGKPVIFEDYYE